MVASVARVRLLVVVMRSVKQTYGPDKAALSAYWTAVDTMRRRWPFPSPPKPRTDKADRPFAAGPDARRRAGWGVANATVRVPVHGPWWSRPRAVARGRPQGAEYAVIRSLHA